MAHAHHTRLCPQPTLLVAWLVILVGGCGSVAEPREVDLIGGWELVSTTDPNFPAEGEVRLEFEEGGRFTSTTANASVPNSELPQIGRYRLDGKRLICQFERPRSGPERDAEVITLDLRELKLKLILDDKVVTQTFRKLNRH